MSWDVRVSMQHNINVNRRELRRYVLQTEFQSTSHEIDNQRPIQITVAISSYNRYSGRNRAQLVENVLGANIAQVPDFIGASGDFTHFFRQTIVRVREHENAPGLFLCFFQVRHILFKSDLILTANARRAPTRLLLTKRPSTATLD